MDRPGGSLLGRVGERVLGYVALALLVLLGVALWRMGPEGRAALWSAIWRTSAWLIVVAVLPWVARLFIGRLLEIGSNWVGVALVGSLTMVDLVVGLILLGGLPSGGWAWVAGLVALAIAGTYNYLVAEYLAEQIGG